MAQLKEGSVIKKSSGDEIIATKEDVDAKIAEDGMTVEFLDGTPTDPLIINADTVNGKTVLTNVPAGAIFSDTVTSINGKTGVIVKTDITALGIPAQDTVYTHPTTAGNKHLPTAGATSNFLIYGGASGTASWSAMSDTLHGTRGGGTQHSVATTSANGFMSGTDKTKLNGIDAGANKITLGTTQPTVGWWFKEIT